MPIAYVRYRDDIEAPEADEGETIDSIIEAMQREGEITRERYGRAVRTSHAKAHGLVRGDIEVMDGLPDELRQGLFASPGRYPVIVRLAHVPGELLDDSRVSTPRGMAIKILGVKGDMLPGHAGDTQDFVLDTGPVFPAPGPKAFLATIETLEKATPRSEGLKQAVSVVSRAMNAALGAVGVESANLDFFGHPPLHPLGETYFSQTPYRYGDYVAKFRVAPVSDALKAWVGQKIDIGHDENALRSAVQDYFRSNPAEFEVSVQLCTDVDKMPIENANTEWSEDESPYRRVARLTLPAQDAYTAETPKVEEALSFCPAHSLAAHRPLGGINRARLKAYGIMSSRRHRENGTPDGEPRSLEEVAV